MTQGTALKILKTGANVFLTGEPGSGKTYTINQYVSYLKNCTVPVAVTASTGIAATHIGGMTIHSWSGIGIKKFLSDYDVDRIATTERTVSRVRKVKVLIIDEISMLDGVTLALVDRVVKEIKQSQKAFGGIQIVFVGDFFQLPPITSQGRVSDKADMLFDEEESPFAFASRAWLGADPLICYLSEQHRQSDNVYLKILSAIRSGNVTPEHHTHLESRRMSADAPAVQNLTKLFPHNADVDRINTLELGKLPSEPHSFEVEGFGRENLVEQLKRGCLSPEHLILKEGAVVMFTKNNFDNGFVNGTLGTVVSFDEDTGYPQVETHKGNTITASPMEWSIEDGGKVLARITQIPLRLAWAMTVHKSQGMSLDSAFMDLASAFVEGQGYVALSRVRTLSGLHLAGYNAQALAVHTDVKDKDNFFRTASAEAEGAFGDLSGDELTKMQGNFIRASGGDPNLANTKRKSPSHLEQKKSKSGGTRATLYLIKEGKTIGEIAKHRSLTEGTILKHLEDLKMRKELSSDTLSHLRLGQENTISIIQKAIQSSEGDKLKPVFTALGEKYSYELIRLARLLLKE